MTQRKGAGGGNQRGSGVRRGGVTHSNDSNGLQSVRNPPKMPKVKPPRDKK